MRGEWEHKSKPQGTERGPQESPHIYTFISLVLAKA